MQGGLAYGRRNANFLDERKTLPFTMVDHLRSHPGEQTTEPVSRLLREDLGQSLQLRIVSGRSRRVGGNQRNCGDAVVGGKPDDIGYALFAVFRYRRHV